MSARRAIQLAALARSDDKVALPTDFVVFGPDVLLYRAPVNAGAWFLYRL